jgi:hypothetical protein
MNADTRAVSAGSRFGERSRREFAAGLISFARKIDATISAELRSHFRD